MVCVVGFLVDLAHPNFPGKTQDTVMVKKKKKKLWGGIHAEIRFYCGMILSPSNRYLGFSLWIKRIILLSYDYRNIPQK